MTILSRVKKPDFELTVCGLPSKAWLEWLKTAEVPLTPGQQWWREFALAKDRAAEQGDRDS